MRRPVGVCVRERERGRIRYFLIGRSVCLSLSLSLYVISLSHPTDSDRNYCYYSYQSIQSHLRGKVLFFSFFYFFLFRRSQKRIPTSSIPFQRSSLLALLHMSPVIALEFWNLDSIM